jgi:hypothetical protein
MVLSILRLIPNLVKLRGSFPETRLPGSAPSV